MRRSLWTVGVAVLAFGGLGMVGGTAIGGDIGPVTAAYGALLSLAALYLLAVLAYRHRSTQRGTLPPSGRPDRMLGQRVF